MTVIKALEETRSVRGYTDSLYRVKQNEREQTIWGGELANAFYRLSDGGLFLVRVVGSGQGKLRQMEARLHRSRGILRFPPIEVQDSDRFGYSLGVLASGGHGLQGVERVFRLKFTYEACDYPNGEVILLQKGEQLVLGPRILSSSGERSSRTYQLLFPHNLGGRPNQIRESATLTERDEKGTIVSKKTILTMYRWNKRHMIK